MKADKTQEKLYWYLLRLAITSKHVLMKITEKYDLTVMQFYTLCMLEDDKSVPMNSLSELLLCDASNVTGIVDRLFQRQLIKREENPRDRRLKMITLTPAGAALCEKIFADLPLESRDGLYKLSDAKKKNLTHLLGEVLEA